MPESEEVLIVVKFRVPRKDAYLLKEEVQEAIDDFVLDQNPDIKLEGEITTEEIQ